MAEAKIWMDGALRPSSEATTHVLSHSLHYGLAAFEGIRAYKTADGRTAVFRLHDHIHRLLASCRAALLDCPYSSTRLEEAAREVVAANGFDEAYIRPLVWLGEGSIKVIPSDNRLHTAVAAWKWGAYLGPEALAKGARCTVSSYTRMNVGGFLEKAKISGQYVNSVLAKREAVLLGFDEAIMLADDGFVAEASAENIFIVRDGTLCTPPAGSAMLCGITRDTIIRLARELGYVVFEQRMSRNELLVADEVFLTGTAAEITAVREIDHRIIGQGRMGPVTQQLQRGFQEIVHGQRACPDTWLSYL